MKWVYIALGIFIIFYIGQAIEHFVISSGEQIQSIRLGAQP